MLLTASAVRPEREQLKLLRLRRDVTTGTECPAQVSCRFVSAATTNYQVSSRPANKLALLYIVIHVVDGSYPSAIDTFQDPGSRLSAHYVMRSSDGAITQMVSNKDVAFHAGNYWFNLHSIGIEHEGFSVQGATWFTPTQYQATAELVRHLSASYHIPLDREHIIGHDNVPGPTRETIPGMHWDPGPYWDWTRFMSLLTQRDVPGPAGPPPVGSVVTIAPDLSTNKQVVRVCKRAARPWNTLRPTRSSRLPTGCTTQSEPSNFLPVRTSPSQAALLFPDPALHPGEDRGTNLIEDWGSTVSAGQRFVVADERKDWTAIWFSGRKGWIFNPEGRNTRRAQEPLRLLRPRAGPASIPVYGTAFPMPSAYPQGWAPSTQLPLEVYGVYPGQAVVATEPAVADDFSATRTSGALVTGTERYAAVQLNHRLALLNSADTDAVGGPHPVT
ncbi:N-acetylmuramoyl-L-alanine amidase [Streptomyces klenkii]|uniref:N-acetylmuramoyl-L-alanine amidase n=1 Tax=Streptomyces klenkii TaxID=1420899 RepID=UPI00343005FA